MRTIVHREEVGSTSDLARSLVEAGEAALPLLVRADRQTAGRGRGMNPWWSDAGSLTFTLAIDPAAHDLRPEHHPRVALAAAVAIVEAVERVAAPATPLGIRWPNDVEANDRKLGGILPEPVETSRGTRLLIGVGLNVATRLCDAPPEVRRLATSLDDLRPPGSPRLGPADLIEPILTSLAIALAALGRDDPSLADRWSRLDTLHGRPIRVDLGPEVLDGRGGGLNADGSLNLLLADRTLRLLGGRVLRADPA